MNRITQTLLAGAGLAVAIGTAAIAQDAMHSPPPGGPRMMKMPETRAEVQAMVAEHFKKLDANGDGSVTKAEFDSARDAMRAMMKKRMAEHREKMFDKLDADKNGSLSKQEFDSPPKHDMADKGDMPPPPGGPDGMRGHGGRMMKMRMMMHGGGGMGDRWFDQADANHDAKLTLAEASSRPLAMFDKADTNHDGKLSDAEKQAAHEAMRAEWQKKRAKR
jgi:hypothetical protein